METLKLLDTVAIDEFLVESQYEVWAKNDKDAPGLYRLAEYLRKNDKVIVSKHSFGRGFDENYALIYPIYCENRFVLVMALTKMRKDYKHLMNITSLEPKTETRKLEVAVLLPEI